MERYPSYKPSGVKWLGEIPSHWEMICTKHIARLYTGNSMNEASKEKYSCFRNDAYPYISSKDISLNNGDVDYENGMYIPRGENSFEVAPANSFLLCIEGGSAGRKKAFLDRECCFVNKLCCYDSAINPKYHYYFIQSAYFRALFNCSLQGMIGGVSVSVLKSFYTIVPPVKEQSAIASYLDTVIVKIDTAIAQQQKMIDLLNERKQIIINRAVTKGLNPDVKMKDSGVEWIGEVPEDWEVMRMRYLCSITTGNKDTINRVEDGLYPFYVRSPKVERINTYSYDGEAVLMAGDGVGAGKVFHYVNGKFDYHQRVYNFYNIKKIKAKLLYYYMKSHFRYVIEQLSAKSTVDSVRLNMIQDFLVVIPPMQEQLDLIEYLDSQMKNLDDSISMFENQISLLQERKQIIINEVVTGKVKVV